MGFYFDRQDANVGAELNGQDLGDRLSLLSNLVNDVG